MAEADGIIASYGNAGPTVFLRQSPPDSFVENGIRQLSCRPEATGRRGERHRSGTGTYAAFHPASHQGPPRRDADVRITCQQKSPIPVEPQTEPDAQITDNLRCVEIGLPVNHSGT
jgi:hypothetical protein